jgi:hypothetical protein
MHISSQELLGLMGGWEDSCGPLSFTILVNQQAQGRAIQAVQIHSLALPPTPPLSLLRSPSPGDANRLS